MLKGQVLVEKNPSMRRVLLWHIANLDSVYAQYELALLFRYKNKEIFECYAYAVYE